jgi:hypothetical protein
MFSEATGAMVDFEQKAVKQPMLFGSRQVARVVRLMNKMI